jgi:DNA-binding transcriptional ArsR family regulator
MSPRLDALVGEPRATLLQALDRPSTVGQLAARLGFVPSAITHHVSVLEPAGLVVRERRGQSVLVHRTQRGTELLALYASR